MNNITIKGNLTSDAEVKILNDKTELISFSFAWNEYKKDEMGNFQPVASFFNVKQFKGRDRYSILDKLTKGAGVVISGHIKQERWTADDGSKRSNIVIIADEITLTQRSEKTEESVNTTNSPVSEDTPF